MIQRLQTILAIKELVILNSQAKGEIKTLGSLERYMKKLVYSISMQTWVKALKTIFNLPCNMNTCASINDKEMQKKLGC